jgi:Xaa-Pro aminopeptidase
MAATIQQELSVRRQRAMEAASAAGSEGLLLYATDGRGYNLRYLTNFAPIYGDAFLAVTPRRTVYLLNFNWEIPRAKAASGLTEFIATFDLIGQTTEVLRALELTRGRLATIGFDRIPHPMYQALRERLPGVEFVDITPAVERLRRTKSPYEVAQLRKAAEVTDAAYAAVRAALRPGMTEGEVAALADQTMKAQGAGELAFPTNVVSGPDRVMPVGLPTERVLREGDAVMIDMAAMWGGYHADMTRTYVVGRPSRAQQAVWDAVREAWQRVVDAIRPGTPCSRLHRIAQETLGRHGHSLVHRIGHGIGLHTSLEWPNLETDDTPLEPGNTFCIEPGVYIPGLGSFKLEDDFVVTDDGFELLSRADRSLA